MLLVWVTVGAGLALAHPWLWEWLLFFSALPHLIYWITAPVAFLILALSDGLRTVGAPALLGYVWLALLWTSGHQLNRLGDMLLLAHRAPAYRSVIEAAQAGTLDRRGEGDGLFHRVDKGPPVRVALDAEGMGDNWSAVVWDPSGIVRTARGWDRDRAGDYTASPAAQELFGGDLVACRRLWGHYHRCHFT